MSTSSSRSALFASSLALFAARADACPCGPGASPVSTLTVPGQRFGVRASVTALTEAATWDERSRVWPAPDGVDTHRLLFELTAAWRPWSRAELSASFGAGYSAVEQPGVSARAFAWGDLLVRARWEAVQRPSWRFAPSIALRAPTGDTVTRTLANGIPGLGLGVWEAALAGELAWRDPDTGEIGFVTELGLRAPSDGWWPGPRVTTTAFGAWRATSWTTCSASVSHVLELDASRDGVRVADSGARRLTVAVGVTLRTGDSLAWSAALAVDPWIDGLGANATATARLTLGLTWLR